MEGPTTGAVGSSDEPDETTTSIGGSTIDVPTSTEALTTITSTEALTTTSTAESSSSATTSDKCSNTPPYFDQVENQVGEVDELLALQMEAHDADGDELSFSGVNLPAGAKIDQLTGLISWTPKSVGTYNVEVEVSDGCNTDSLKFTIKVLVDKSDSDGDGFPAETDCDDQDPSTFPLKPGYNLLSKSAIICDGTYKSWIVLKGSGITIDAHKLGVVLQGGYLELNETNNSIVRNIHITETSGVLTNGTFFTSAVFLTSSDGNKLEFVTAECEKEYTYTCDFTAFLQASSDNTINDCAFIEGKYSLVLGLDSDDNTITSTKFASPETAWVEDQGTGNKLLNNEYL
jgi:hypothetical protein